MPNHYVLVDFENVQPENLAALAGGAFKVKVFIGAAQAKGRISFELSHSIQMLGASAEYVRIARSGPNAMDMHIAYYIGKLLELEPGAAIDVISRDTDFDPLLEFLRAQGFKVRRVKAIAEVAKSAAPASKKAPARTAAVMKPAKHAAVPKPAQKPAAASKSVASDKFEAVARQLRSMSGKPANRRKLAQAINAYLVHHGGSPGAKAVEQIIDELIRRKLVTPVGTKLNYTLD